MNNKEQIVVLEIEQNIVKGISLYLDVDSAESAMIQKCKNLCLNLDSQTAADILDNGYFEYKNQSVCITWPESCDKPLFAVISCDDGVCDECSLFPDEGTARAYFVDLLNSKASNSEDYSWEDISAIIEQGFERINTTSINIMSI